RLPHLVNLKLSYDVRTFREAQLGNSDANNSFLAQLPSVMLLKLDVILSTHEDLALLHLAWIFPNVQVIRATFDLIFGDICTICNHRKPMPKDKNQVAESQAKMNACQLKLFAP